MENQVVTREAQILQAIPDGFARVNVTFAGMNGDMTDPIRYDATDGDIKAMVAEAIRSGSIPGVTAQTAVDLSDFVVDRFTPTADRPFATMTIRPKTAFGA